MTLHAWGSCAFIDYCCFYCGCCWEAGTNPPALVGASNTHPYAAQAETVAQGAMGGRTTFLGGSGTKPGHQLSSAIHNRTPAEVTLSATDVSSSQLLPGWYTPATSSTTGQGSSLYGDALLGGALSWPAGILSVVSEVSRMAATMAEMQGAVAQMSRKVDQTIDVGDLRGLLQVIQPQLQGVAASLSDLAASQAATRVAVLAAQDATSTAITALPPRLMAVASALKELASGQEQLLKKGNAGTSGAPARGGVVLKQQDDVSTAALQLQNQLGEQSRELMRLANAATAVISGTNASPAAASDSERQIMSAQDQDVEEGVRTSPGSVPAAVRPPSRQGIYVVASWSLKGFDYKVRVRLDV